MIKFLDSSGGEFDTALDELLKMPEESQGDVEMVVAEILEDVQIRGDAALLELTNKFDHVSLATPSELEIHKDRMRDAVPRVDPLVLDALKTSIDRVRTYHEKQKQSFGGQKSWDYKDPFGNKLGQIVRGMQRVGVYVPGGKASYPSSVVMTVIPAKVAEVDEVILVVPAPNGEILSLIHI